MNIRIIFIFIFILFFLSSLSPAENYKGIVINEIQVANASSILDTRYGNYSDWIELYNTGDEPVDLRGCYLSDDLANPQKIKFRFRTLVEPKKFKLLWLDEKAVVDHVEWKLSRHTEIAGLFSPEGEAIDVVFLGPQQPDVSYGRQPDGSRNWFFFDTGTPGAANDQDGITWLNRTDVPKFSIPGGMYSGRPTLELSTSSPNAEIYYTLDGSIPTQKSTLYTRNIRLTSTKVVRARCFEKNRISSPIITQTFFLNDYHTLPTISISTNPDHLFDSKIGIYVEGTRGIQKYCSEGPRNWNQDWERPISIELYEPDGNLGFRLDAGMKIFGGCSRLRDQKSFAIYLRDQYGLKEVYYPLFPDKPIVRFTSFVLRNSGNDNNLTQFRDGLMQGLVKDGMDIDTQAYRPAIVYINGKYWGILNIREKINESYPEGNHGADPDNIDLLQNNKEVFAGDAQHYTQLLAYINKNDMRASKHYLYIKTQMDVNEYINYQIAQIYFSNTDWPGNNIKYWRPKTDKGRWRWILFDLDFGFNQQSNGVNHNTLDFACATNGPDWPNPPWSTLLFRKLLLNPEFQQTFIQRFASCFNTLFAPDRVVAQIDRYKKTIEPEMPDHIERWNRPASMKEWDSNIQKMISFAKLRPRLLQKYIQRKFSLGNLVDVNFSVSEEGKGTIYVNEIPLTENHIIAPYYEYLPIQVKAVPKPGYRFLRWEEMTETKLDTLTQIVKPGLSLTAVFEKGDTLVINEIHYNPSVAQGESDAEFIELYHAGKTAIDVSDYSIRKGIRFSFPEGTIIQPGEFIVIARNSKLYSTAKTTALSWEEGKLANEGEEIRLIDRFGHILNSVRYGVSAPWPQSPNGRGYTLSLSNPASNNSDPLNWLPSSIKGGSPGRPNFAGSKSTAVADWFEY